MRNKKLIVLFSVLCALTLLVVFNSVLFSVRHVRAYCANVQNSAYAEQVLAAHGIKRAESIFFVNKKQVAAQVESKVPQVRVLNVEKKFPDRIYINYIEKSPYLRLYDVTNDKTYFCANDLRVMYAENGNQTLWSGAENSEHWSGFRAINLVCDDSIPLMKAGDTVAFSGASTAEVLKGICTAFERLGYYEQVIDLFTEWDVSGLGAPSAVITLTMALGLKWEIVSADRNLADKIRLALSVYASDALTAAQKSEGTLVIAGEKASYRDAAGSIYPLG